jgi:hypothetical protein
MKITIEIDPEHEPAIVAAVGLPEGSSAKDALLRHVELTVKNARLAELISRDHMSLEELISRDPITLES